MAALGQDLAEVLLTARLLWGERLIPLASGENIIGRDGERRLESDPVPLRDGDVLRFGRIELVFLGAKEKGSTQTVVD